MIEILHCERDFLVCVKPVGLDSEHAMPAALEAQVGGKVFGVHRLDLNVGGVMVFGRTKQGTAAMTKAVLEGTMVKEYVACVHGTPPESGDWENFLYKDSKKNKVFAVKRERPGVKYARLEFIRLQAGERSFVRVRLHTGRTHQIRVQFASRGFPLVGDHKYGSHAKETAPMLFSCRLRFPWKGQELTFSALPAWFSPEEEI